MLLISLLQFSILSVLLAAAKLKFSNGPKAIVFIHGILGNYQEGSDIQQWVSEVSLFVCSRDNLISNFLNLCFYHVTYENELIVFHHHMLATFISLIHHRLYHS